MQHTAGGEQLAACGFHLLAQLGDGGGDLRRGLHVEGIAAGAQAQQGPGGGAVLQQQRAAAEVGLDAAAGVERLLGAQAEAEPVLLGGQQAEAGEGVEQLLGTLLDKGVRLLDQQLAVGRRQQGQAFAA